MSIFVLEKVCVLAKDRNALKKLINIPMRGGVDKFHFETYSRNIPSINWKELSPQYPDLIFASTIWVENCDQISQLIKNNSWHVIYKYPIGENELELRKKLEEDSFGIYGEWDWEKEKEFQKSLTQPKISHEEWINDMTYTYAQKIIKGLDKCKKAI